MERLTIVRAIESPGREGEGGRATHGEHREGEGEGGGGGESACCEGGGGGESACGECGACGVCGKGGE